jgi:cytochrome c oxidase assembly factor 2
MPDGTRRRRRRPKVVDKEGDAEISKEEPLVEGSSDDTRLDQLSKSKRGECPIPKPGGIVGEILGFKPSSSDGKSSKPP